MEVTTDNLDNLAKQMERTPTQATTGAIAKVNFMHIRYFTVKQHKNKIYIVITIPLFAIYKSSNLMYYIMTPARYSLLNVHIIFKDISGDSGLG